MINKTESSLRLKVYINGLSFADQVCNPTHEIKIMSLNDNLISHKESY
jgi:SHS2 domain-containing protein